MCPGNLDFSLNSQANWDVSLATLSRSCYQRFPTPNSALEDQNKLRFNLFTKIDGSCKHVQLREMYVPSLNSTLDGTNQDEGLE